MPCRKRSAHVLAFCVRDEACACVMSFSGRAKGTLPNGEAQGCRYRAKGTQHFATQAGGDHCATRTQGQEKLEPRVRAEGREARRACGMCAVCAKACMHV